MFKQKKIAAFLLAVVSAFSLVGISYFLFPEDASVSKSPPIPEYLSDQLFWVIQMLGLVAFVAIVVVGTISIIGRIRKKKTLTQPSQETLTSHFFVVDFN